MSKVPQYVIKTVRDRKPHHYALFDGLYVVSLMINTKYRQKRGDHSFFEFASEASGNYQYVTLSSVSGDLNLAFYDVKHQVWWPVSAEECMANYTADDIANLQLQGYVVDYKDPHNLFHVDVAEQLKKRLGGEWECWGGEIKCGYFKISADLNRLTNEGFIYGPSRSDIAWFLDTLLERVEKAYLNFKRFDLTEIYNQTVSGTLSFEEFSRLLKGLRP